MVLVENSNKNLLENVEVGKNVRLRFQTWKIKQPEGEKTDEQNKHNDENFDIDAGKKLTKS